MTESSHGRLISGNPIKETLPGPQKFYVKDKLARVSTMFYSGYTHEIVKRLLEDSTAQVQINKENVII